MIPHPRSTSGWKRVVHESETIQNRAFDRTFVGASMLVNNAKSGNWCRCPRPVSVQGVRE